MQNKALNVENILNIIFKTTTKSAQFFADSYLKKDISIVSRWKNNTVVPKVEDLRKVVEFAVSESTGVQRVVMKEEIIKLLDNSSLKRDIHKVIVEKEDFEDFLIEALSILTVDYENIISKCNNPINHNTNAQQCKDNKSDEPEAHSCKISGNEKDVIGNYTGVVQFDLLMLKQKGKENKEYADSDKNNINLSISAKQGDINKIIKHILSRMTIGIIVLVSISGFLIAQASDNSQLRTLKNTYSNTVVTPAATTLAISTPISSRTPIKTAIIETNKSADLKSKTLSDDNIAQLNTPVVTSKHASNSTSIPKVTDHSPSKPPEGEHTPAFNKDASISNPNSNNTGIINNFNINIEGNNNKLASGNSIIISEDD